MGVDKATLLLDGEPLGVRAGRVLREACEPVIEVGPGYSGLDAVADDDPGGGPLGGLLTGARALQVAGPVVLLGCDLPLVDADLLAEIAAYPGSGTVVPVDGTGVPQVVCGRYSTAALARGAELFAEGRHSLQPLLELPDARTPDDWCQRGCWEDVDTPEQARRFGIAMPR